MFSLLLLCSLCVFILSVLRARLKRGQCDKDVPIYSKALPLIGITHLLLATTHNTIWGQVQHIIDETIRRGGVLKATLGLDTYYAITDPEDALTVANACLEKHHVYKFAECWLGQSLISAPAAKWKVHRKLLCPAFSLPVLHGFMKLFNSQAKSLVEQLGAAAKKGPFKSTSYIQYNILKGSCLSAFGEENLDEETFQDYITGVIKLFDQFVQRFLKPWNHIDFMYKLCGGKDLEDKIVNTLTSISDKLIKKVQNDTLHQQKPKIDFDNGQAETRTFLDMYLQLNSNATNKLTLQEIREQLDLTIMAAYDTTAIQLELVLIHIGSYPEIQERMFEEIIQVIGEDKDVDKEDLNKLVYTEAVIKEILRIAPMAPMIARNIEKDVKLKNYTLRADSYALIMLQGVNRDPSWGPDADQFRPERWLVPGGVPVTASNFATFSIGKRNCIGKTYGMISLKVSVTYLIRKYRIEADCTKIEYKLDAFAKPVKGNELVLTPRSPSMV